MPPPSREKELIGRWQDICLKDEDLTVSDATIQKLKEDWFRDAFKFLKSVPITDHSWCNHFEIVYPLLEPFFHFTDSLNADRVLSELWRHLSADLSRCTSCVYDHLRAIAMYKEDQKSEIGQILVKNLTRLDCERISQKFRDSELIITKKNLTPEVSKELRTTVLEVLANPDILEDLAVNRYCGSVIQHIVDSTHFSLEDDVKYPGVYTLFFHEDKNVRATAFKLANRLPKFRHAEDLEAIQPLIKSCMQILELDLFAESKPAPKGIYKFLARNKDMPPVMTTGDRESVKRTKEEIWLGLQSLIGFMDPLALENGLLENYPAFFGFVFDQINGDSTVFRNALNILKAILNAIGYKLWEDYSSNYSPSMVRDSLITQCFHTKQEATHKSLLDLIVPYLKSLEALGHGEFEKQRRRFLYFLIKQVPCSSCFSSSIKKIATQIALSVVKRGYTMQTPIPPTECVHVWGPTLVSSVSDSKLLPELRQPAIDLFRIILSCDVAALVSAAAKDDQNPDSILEDGLFSVPKSSLKEEESADIECQLRAAAELAESESSDWHCVPAIWMEILTKLSALEAPEGMHVSAIWAIGQLSLLDDEAENEGVEKALSDDFFLRSLKWANPNGYDDRNDSDDCPNSVALSSKYGRGLVKFLGKCLVAFLSRVHLRQLARKSPWVPLLSESLFLWRLCGKANIVHNINSQLTEPPRGNPASFMTGSKESIVSMAIAIRRASLFLCRQPTESIPLNKATTLLSDVMEILQQSGSSVLRTGTEPKAPHRQEEMIRKCVAESIWPILVHLLKIGNGFGPSKFDCHLDVFGRVIALLPLFGDIGQLALSWSGHSRSQSQSDPRHAGWIVDLMNLNVKIKKTVLESSWEDCVLSCLKKLADIEMSVPDSVRKIIEELMQSDYYFSVEKRTLLSTFLSQDFAVQKAGRSQWPAMARKQDLPISLLSDLSSGSSAMTDEPKGQEVEEDEDDSLAIGSLLSKRKEVPEAAETKPRSFPETAKRLRTILGSKSTHKSTLKSTPEVPKSAPLESSPFSSAFGDLKPRAKTEFQSTPLAARGRTFDHLIPKSRSSSGASGRPPGKLAELRAQVPRPYMSANQRPVSRLVEGGDDLDKVLDAARPARPPVPRQQSSEPTEIRPKRQLIALSLPQESLRGSGGRPLKVQSGPRVRPPPPKLEDWLKTILGLDYLAIVGLSPGEETRKDPKAAGLRRVPVRFDSVDDYMAVFRPLLLEEFKAQLQQTYEGLKEGGSRKEGSGIAGSLKLMSLERVDCFSVGRFVSDESARGNDDVARRCTENDLVLLTKLPLEKSAGCNLHFLGKVERREWETKSRESVLQIKFYLPDSVARLATAKFLLKDRSKWNVTKLMSIVPQQREYQALASVHGFPLTAVILGGQTGAAGQGHGHRGLGVDSLPVGLRERLKSEYNDPQLAAIGSILDCKSEGMYGHDLTLVQGPPGTGKTRTILAIVSALLASRSASSTNQNEAQKERFQPVEKAARSSCNPRTKLSAMEESALLTKAFQAAAVAQETSRREKQQEGRSGGSHGLALKQRCRVLVCAQSNAAVDELVARFSAGIYDSNGAHFQPSVVRVGNRETVHPDSMAVFIDTLVEAEVGTGKGDKGADPLACDREKSAALRKKMEEKMELIRNIEMLKSQSGDAQDSSRDFRSGSFQEAEEVVRGGEVAVKNRLDVLYREKREMSARLAAADKEQKKMADENRALRQAVRRKIIRESQIVLTTLSGCGGDIYSACADVAGKGTAGKKELAGDGWFDAVVIDEAAQALETATLIPLQLLADSHARCIMVGDPKQLPATVLSQTASKFSFERSMFERLQIAGHPVKLLTTQYRMHPEICQFPSRHFYDGQLSNGPGISSASRAAPFHRHVSMRPYVFFDVEDGQERVRKGNSPSLFNESEAQVAMEIVSSLRKWYPAEVRPGRIGIITPYKQQLFLLRDLFSRYHGSELSKEIEFNTVDGFQGREVDFLIFSTVRASPGANGRLPGGAEAVEDVRAGGDAPQRGRGIGFVGDVRRMNVALTRARISLWILGNAETLTRSPPWEALITDARSRGVVIPIRQPYRSYFGRQPVDCQTQEDREASAQAPEMKEKVNVLAASADLTWAEAPAQAPKMKEKVNALAASADLTWAGEVKRRRTPAVPKERSTENRSQQLDGGGDGKVKENSKRREAMDAEVRSGQKSMDLSARDQPQGQGRGQGADEAPTLSLSEAVARYRIKRDELEKANRDNDRNRDRF